MPGEPTSLCDLTARRLASAIRRKEASAREVMDAHLERIEQFNPTVNAIVTIVADEARDAADALAVAIAAAHLGGR